MSDLSYELYKLETQKQKILANIMEKVGQFDDGEMEALQMIQDDVKDNVLEYGLTVTDKEIQNEMDKLKTFKARIDQRVKALETAKNKIRYQVHAYLMENGPIEYHVDGETKFLKAGHTVSRTIVEENVEEEKGKYIVEIDGDDYVGLMTLINDSEAMEGKNDEMVGEGLKHLIKVMQKKAKRKLVLKDLPENHAAISKSLNPQIKSVKKL